MSDPYVYPGTQVLINTYDTRDQALLDVVERRHTLDRMAQGVPTGPFDHAHLQAIHHHIFQDVYPWAGEIRTTPLRKGESTFLHPGRIETGLGNIHNRLETQNFLADLSSADFAAEASEIVGDLNYIHPFREGNGRTQLLYLDQLALQAGHPLDLTMTDREIWYAASIASFDGEHAPMRQAIGGMMIEPDHSIAPDQDDPGIDLEPDL